MELRMKNGGMKNLECGEKRKATRIARMGADFCCSPTFGLRLETFDSPASVCWFTFAPVKVRIDQALVDRGLCESRTQAARAVMAGQVRINGHPARKASDPVREGDAIEWLHADRYVSRGGHKLEHALKHFAVDSTGMRAIDLGASTGGFTDCLLQHGASRVVAIDVGHGQLAWKIRQDPRVEPFEKVNARHLTLAQLGQLGSSAEPFDLAVIDCSFISLRLILPPAVGLLRGGGRIVALIKPQFEAGREEVSRGAGVIEDPAVHSRVLQELEAFVAASLPGVGWRGVTESPLLGPAGNREFLALLEKNGSPPL